MTAADRFSILIGLLSLMTAILGGMLRFLWKLAGTLSTLDSRIRTLEKAQDGAVTIRTRRHARGR